MEEDIQKKETDLIAFLEKKRGGKISFRTIALYYADSAGRRKESVFVYQIDDRIYLEDFEREFRFLGFKVNPPRGYVYKKFEAYFYLDDIQDVSRVLKSDVEKFVKGKRKEIRCVSGKNFSLRQFLVKLSFRDGENVFLELINSGDLEKIIRDYKKSS